MRRTPWTLLAVAATIVAIAALAGVGRTAATQPEHPSEHPGEHPGAAADTPRAKVIAVKFHADWCGFCKAMGPVFEEMQAKFDQEPVLYVEFDQTREFDRRQSVYMAGALGLDGVWMENGGKTGFVLLVDATTKEVIQRLSHEQSLKEMGAALQEAVGSATEPTGGSDHPDHPKK